MIEWKGKRTVREGEGERGLELKWLEGNVTTLMSISFTIIDKREKEPRELIEWTDRTGWRESE